MASAPPSETALRVADLSQSGENHFALRPGPDELAEIAAALELSALRKLSFAGRITPLGGSDWTMTARLGATVVQPCVITLEPVTTRIDVDITRQFIRDYDDPEEPEVEMAEDDSVERLGAWIDPAIVMQEALSIAVPDYPRKEEAELGEMIYTKPGDAADDRRRRAPFRGACRPQKQAGKPRRLNSGANRALYLHVSQYFAALAPISVGHRRPLCLKRRNTQSGVE